MAKSNSRACVSKTLLRVEYWKQPVRVRSRLLRKFCYCLPRTQSGPCWKWDWDGHRRSAEAATQNYVVTFCGICKNLSL